MAIYNAKDASAYLLDLYEKNISTSLDGGWYNRQDLEQFFGAFGVSGKISLMVKVLNDLESYDEILNQIMITSPDSVAVEIWANGDWGKGSTVTRSEGSEIKKRQLSIPMDYYSHQVNIDRNELIRAMAQSATNGRANSAMVGIDLAIIEAVKGYKSLMRKLAFKAIFAKPASQDKTLPILYRDTTTFSAENQVIPPRNGLLEFETAVSQEHHLASATVSDDILKQLKNLIVNKGGSSGSITVFANETTWGKLMAGYTKDELEALKIIRDLGIEDIAISPITTTVNVALPDSDFPTDYWMALDMSKKILQKRVQDVAELAGVMVEFNTLGKVMQLNPQAPQDALRLMAEGALLDATVTGGFKLGSYAGFGVISAGSGAVAFTGGATYQEPNFFV